jgi:hypothetical protein
MRQHCPALRTGSYAKNSWEFLQEKGGASLRIEYCEYLRSWEGGVFAGKVQEARLSSHHRFSAFRRQQD